MFEPGPSDKPCKILKIQRSDSSIKSVSPACDVEYYRDCYRISGKLLLFTDDHIFTIAEETMGILQENEVSNIHLPIEFLRCSNTYNKSSIVMACKVFVEYADEFGDDKPDKVYEAWKIRGNTLLFQCSYNTEKLALQMDKEHIMIKQDLVDSIC